MANRVLIDDETISLLEGRDLNIRALMDGLFGGSRPSPYFGSSMEFADYRDYVPGDDVRRIDWNLYGRTDKLYVKLFTDERRQHHRVYIDCSASMAWGSPEKHLTALRLAAAIGYLAVSGTDRISWYALEKKNCRRVTESVSSRDRLLAQLDRLAALRCGGDTCLDEAVMRCPDPGYHDGVSFLISDFLTEGNWKAAVDWLLGRKREVCLIQVLSRDETGPSANGRLRFMDTEAETEEDVRNLRMEVGRRRLQAYAEAYRWLISDIEAFAESRGVRYMQAPAEVPVSRLLFERGIRTEMIR